MRILLPTSWIAAMVKWGSAMGLWYKPSSFLRKPLPPYPGENLGYPSHFGGTIMKVTTVFLAAICWVLCSESMSDSVSVTVINSSQKCSKAVIRHAHFTDEKAIPQEERTWYHSNHMQCLLCTLHVLAQTLTTLRHQVYHLLCELWRHSVRKKEDPVTKSLKIS